MATLIDCIECGRKFTSSIGSCPHCKSLYPRGLNCCICGRFGKQSEMIYLGGHKSYGYDHCYAHGPCLAAAQHEYESEDHHFRCPTCEGNIPVVRMEFEGWDPSREQTNCGNCGERWLRVYSQCPICNHPVFVQHGVKIPTTYSDPYFAHRCCYRSRPIKVKKNCFIATVACGEDSREVMTLRDFRDTQLSSTPTGRIIVRIYEFVSPPVANAIDRNETIRRLARWAVVIAARLVARLVRNSGRMGRQVGINEDI